MPLLIFLFFQVLQVSSPSHLLSDEDTIKGVIISLFDGMRASDGEQVKQCFLSEATMHTSYNNKLGEPKFKEGNLQEFIDAVAAPKEQIWDEKILSYTILIDDNLATAWCPYQFYLDDQLLHCGVNAFQFIKGSEGWKIMSITDTRRKKGCLE